MLGVMTELLLAALVGALVLVGVLLRRRPTVPLSGQAIDAVISVANERLGAHTAAGMREMAVVQETVLRACGARS